MTLGGGKASEERGRKWKVVGWRLVDLGRPLPLPLPHIMGSCHPQPPQASAALPEVGRGRPRDSPTERLDYHKAQNCHVIKYCVQIHKNRLFRWDSILF